MFALKFTILLIFAVISMVYGDLLHIQASKSTNAAYPNHCFDKASNSYYLPRAEFYNRAGKCQKIFCHADYSMDAQGCGSADVTGCKKLPYDFNKEYPECCPKFDCKGKIVTPPYA